MTSITIVHPLYLCAGCEGTADVPLYHFAWNDGQNVSIAHGCEHFIRDCYPDDPPPAEWLAERAVEPGADCIMPSTTTGRARYATIAEAVSEYLTHYIDDQATVTIDPASVEAVLDRGDLTPFASFGEHAEWVAALIREIAVDYC
jgi:hypothetical protein